MRADPKRPWKAVAAAIVALGGSLGTALTDGQITGEETSGIIITTVAAGLAVYFKKNPAA